MEEKNIVVETLKLLGAVVAGWLIWTIIFACMPGESVEANEPFAGASLVFGIITVLLLILIIRYNAVTMLYQNMMAAFSNIQVYEEKGDRLLDKANKVADKYMTFEENVQVGVSKMRGQSGKLEVNAGKKVTIQNANQFQAAVENYPDLKANSGIMELLRQIKECETSLMQQKVIYNAKVEEYNTVINSFPTNLLGKIFKFKEASFYTKNIEDDEISDEELGI